MDKLTNTCPIKSGEDYLATLVEGCLVSEFVARLSAELLREVLVRAQGLASPRISPGPDGMVGMTWENDSHHVNVEIFSDGHVEFFYEDSKSGELWNEGHQVPTVTVPLLDRIRRT